MVCVLEVALRFGERLLRPVLILLGLAAVIQFLSNVFCLYGMLYNDYNEFSLARVIMLTFGILLSGAALTVSNILRKGPIVETVEIPQENRIDAERHGKIALPSVLVLVFGFFILVIWLHGEQSFLGQMSIVYTGGLVVLVLMILRQSLTMYQIRMLQEQLRKKNRSLDLLNAQLECQVTTDPLTNLPNHRALANTLDQIVAQTHAAATSCSVIFMDIDHFKWMNDRYGHLVGDTMLGHFAQIVSSTVHADDVVGRWGGEEFVAILPETGTEQAVRIAEQIRLEVKRQVPPGGGVDALTCSLGVATSPQDASEQAELLKNADRAMYAAKRLGRNQVRTAHEALLLTRQEAVSEAHNDEEVRMVELAEALRTLLEARDPSLGQHARRVALLSFKLAQELRLRQHEARLVRLGGLLHGLGEIAMSDTVLFSVSRVDEVEREELVRYSVIGANILLSLPALRSLAVLVRAYTERMDGHGYPDGLAGEKIPLGARIIAVANAYDTACEGRSSVAILHELRRAAGSRFDPCVVEALARVLAFWPHLSSVSERAK